MANKHKFQVGEKVRLPGRQFKTTGNGWANKFLWDQTGTVEELGWSKPRIDHKVVGGGEPVLDENGKVKCYTSLKTEAVEVRSPVYKVDGKWRAARELKKI